MFLQGVRDPGYTGGRAAWPSLDLMQLRLVLSKLPSLQHLTVDFWRLPPCSGAVGLPPKLCLKGLNLDFLHCLAPVALDGVATILQMFTCVDTLRMRDLSAEGTEPTHQTRSLSDTLKVNTLLIWAHKTDATSAQVRVLEQFHIFRITSTLYLVPSFPDDMERALMLIPPNTSALRTIDLDLSLLSWAAAQRWSIAGQLALFEASMGCMKDRLTTCVSLHRFLVSLAPQALCQQETHMSLLWLVPLNQSLRHLTFRISTFDGNEPNNSDNFWLEVVHLCTQLPNIRSVAVLMREHPIKKEGIVTDNPDIKKQLQDLQTSGLLHIGHDPTCVECGCEPNETHLSAGSI